MGASTRSLNAAESERVRAALQALKAELKTQERIAEAIGASQSAVSAALQQGNLVGPKLARCVAHHLGVTFDELVTGEAAPRGREMRWLPGFDLALEEAVRRVPGLEPELRQLATDRTNREVERVTPETLIALAMAWNIAPRGG